MGSPLGPSGLRLHHVGHAVRRIEDAAVLYVARFGYEEVTAVIHDPQQTAHVQFFRLPGDAVYLELVAPDGPESRLTNAVRRGGGLNHLCYSVGSLEPAAEAMEATGMKLISEPKPATAFGGRRICWLMGNDGLPVELVERLADEDRCEPAVGVPV